MVGRIAVVAGVMAIGSVAAVDAAIVPLDATGYAHDLVVSLTDTASDSLDFNDGRAYGFYEAGRLGTSQGLPTSGQINIASADLSFQLRPYGTGATPSQANTSSNALMMWNGNATATLTLTSPGALDKLAVLATSANGGGTGSVTVNLIGGGSFTTEFAAPDWFGGTTNVALGNIGRWNNATGSAEQNDDNPRLYYTAINVPAQFQSTAVQSLTFTKPAGAAQTTVLAISGQVVPEPATLGVVGLAAVSMLRRRRA